MGSTIKRPFRSFNGKDWDIHYFDTSEDMIKSGWTQKPRQVPTMFVIENFRAGISGSLENRRCAPSGRTWTLR